VATDDLDAPLGAKKKPKKPKLPFKLGASLPQIVAGLLALTIVAAGLWSVFASDPFGGEPIAVVATHLDPAAAGGAAQNADGGGADGTRRYDGPAPGKEAAAAAVPPGSTTVTIIDGSSGQSQKVIIPGKDAAAAKPAGESKLLEKSRHGAIPQIATDGTRPSQAYARPVKAPPALTGAPRIAIVIGGLGVSASATSEALQQLPAPVTLAFAPYGTDVDKVAARALAADHEVLLQVPMEPFDYPDNDPGPQTLLTSLTADQNIDRLQWLMSRMQGYVGLASLMGARFTASEQALAPVLREAARRGLIFVDDGSSPRSVAQQIAGSNNLPFARADVVIDAVPTQVEIDRALTRLEMQAREKGVAVGYATALPSTVTRIAAWTKKAESRGFLLVPISMVAIKTKSS
jgi:polysaccharide deacetylase 2 family uncharacterized protein YibQ